MAATCGMKRLTWLQTPDLPINSVEGDDRSRPVQTKPELGRRDDSPEKNQWASLCRPRPCVHDTRVVDAPAEVDDWHCSGQ